MRIAITSSIARRVGGCETYLAALIPELRRAGHEIALWYEFDQPKTYERIVPMPCDIPVWCAAELGARDWLDGLRAWRPNVIYAHGLEDPMLEERTLEIAPAVFFAHAYYGTCISGGKTFK